MMQKENQKKIAAIVVFYSIAVVCRYLSNKTPLLASIEWDFLRKVLTGIGPAVGAFVASRIFGFKLGLSLKGKFHSFSVPLVIYWFLPCLLIGGLAYLANGTVPVVLVLTALVYGAMEEIGWRGFLQPLLAPLPKLVSISVIAVLWFAWHLNFDLSLSTLIFFIVILLGTWGIGLVANKSHSLLAVAAFHSLNNFFSDYNSTKLMVLAMLIVIWVLSMVYFEKIAVPACQEADRTLVKG